MSGRPSKCKSCGRCDRCKKAEYQREWSRRNPDRVKANKKPAVARANSHKTTCAKYGITVEQYAEMLRRQHGVCAICGEPETLIRNGTLCNLTIDHDHGTGQVRGLFCNNCNRAIGLLKDDSAVLREATAYLDRFEY